MMEKCSKLEQVALNIPRIYLDHDETEIRDDIERFAVRQSTVSFSREKQLTLKWNALAAAPALRTLRTVTLPEEDDLDFELLDNEMSSIFVTTALQRHATLYLNQVPNLSAVSVIYSRDQNPITAGELTLQPRFYGRGQVVNAYGKADAVAIKMTKERLQEVEPVSDILNLQPYGWRFLRSGCKP